jgi:cytochrome c
MRTGTGLTVLLLAATAFPLLSLSADCVATRPDPDAGEQVYARCLACHSPDRNRTGPMHCGLFGRVSGTASGSDYSDAMRAAAIIWNSDTLDRFLEAPLAMVPGTSMGFAGIADRDERRKLIAWLATLTASSPLCNGD